MDGQTGRRGFLRFGLSMLAMGLGGASIAGPALAEAVLRMVQEALTNSARHAGATTLAVSLVQHDGCLRVAIEDDGHLHGAVREGNGLAGMRERIDALGYRGWIGCEYKPARGAAPHATRDGLGWLWGSRGILKPLVRAYFDFYRADFHPWQHDNLHLVQQYRGEFDTPAS